MELTVEELVRRYNITLGKYYGRPGTIRTANVMLAKRDNALPVIASRKAEILSFLEEKEAEQIRKAEEKAKKAKAEKEVFERIEGLVELRNARDEWDDWRYEFNRAMDAGDSVFKECPKSSLKELEEKYPDAVWALMIDDKRMASNFEIASIAQKAYDSIVAGVAISDVKAVYDADTKDFVNRHMWD